MLLIICCLSHFCLWWSLSHSNQSTQFIISNFWIGCHVSIDLFYCNQNSPWTAIHSINCLLIYSWDLNNSSAIRLDFHLNVASIHNSISCFYQEFFNLSSFFVSSLFVTVYFHVSLCIWFVYRFLPTSLIDSGQFNCHFVINLDETG